MKRAPFLLVVLLIGCQNDGQENILEEYPLVSPPSIVRVIDKGNKGTGSDILLTIAKPEDLSNIEEFRIFFVPWYQQTNFKTRNAFEAEHYTRLPTDISPIDIAFPSNLVDVNGNLVRENYFYAVFAMSIASYETTLGGSLSVEPYTFIFKQRELLSVLTGTIGAGTGGMSTDAEGNIYMGDYGTSNTEINGTSVYKITPRGEVSTFAVGFNGATGNDFDNDGNLYQLSYNDNLLYKINPAGEVSSFASGFSEPLAIVFDGIGSFYVCNCGTNSISKVDLSGNVEEFLTDDLLSCPGSIDIDDEGTIYVLNHLGSDLIKITPSGEASLYLRLVGSRPKSILVRGDKIYVVSREDHQIDRINPDGSFERFMGGFRGTSDGLVDVQRFALPYDLAMSPDGRFIYVNQVDEPEYDVNYTTLEPRSPSIIRVIDMIHPLDD